MASVDTLTFDEAAYNPGDVVTLTVDYTPDAPSAVPQTFTATVNVTNAAGAVVATNTAPFVVNQPQPSGDVVSVSDDGSRDWTAVSDNGSVAVFTTAA